MQNSVAGLATLVGSSPRQTFVLYPLLLLVWECGVQRRLPRLDLRFAFLALAGYLLYGGAGRFREAKSAGEPGFKKLPDHLLTTGPYAYSRNPMYLGHVLFAIGLTLAMHSRLGWLAVIERVVRFNRRVLLDEQRLKVHFGEPYEQYLRRVRRWVPYVF